MSASPTGARCGQHPDAAAVALCARCGGYLCGACTEVVEATAYCAPCAERHLRHTRPSRAVRWALLSNVLGLLALGAPLVHAGSAYRRWAGGWGMILALVATLAAAVAGTVIATRKLRRREEVGDRGLATVLRVLAALNLLGLLLYGALTVFVLALVRREH
ncbi:MULTISPECIES: hypothetical protein [unclassified Corallococcus]|uniref:hypothetical protein n=1 Tax=unclassified Corallococcus TaxID=2685029 RepID=UPI001A8DEFCF|nr:MULTISPECIES: hypothetical protein [unclassified Corallococcus]MBN9680953.1 hypothetical protein [Corallococcus sp. NCSPR001]WAS87449.1 hypothetical protein O0N60_10825 [Corallococcus sp. NCRR]